MSDLPPELDFSTPSGRDATPERMNRAMGYLIGRIRALDAARANYDAVVEQLHATGLERLTEALQPVYDQASEMAEALTATQAALDTADWRGALISDVVAAVVTEIQEAQLYVMAGTGTQGVALHAGVGVPANALGADGDLYVQGG